MTIDGTTPLAPGSAGGSKGSGTPDHADATPRQSRGLMGEAVHPAQRPVEPEHPMMLDGDVIPGDPLLMARCMIEELLMMGMPLDEVQALSRDPNIQALYSMRITLGESAFEEIVEEVAQRIGRRTYRTVEHTGDVQGVTLTLGGDRSSA
jgi:hypothetical protein